VGDDGLNDRTHRATIDGAAQVVYARGADEFERRTPVSRRDPDARRTLRLRVHVEPFMDTGIAPEAGAQIVGLWPENGMIKSMAYEFDPDAASVGENDRRFTFIDENGNFIHDADEPSEAYLDLSRGVIVMVDEDNPPESFYKGGDQGDNADVTEGANGWGPVVTDSQIQAELERAKIAWAQAGIKVEMVGDPIIEEAPTNADGESILHDGWLRSPTFESETIIRTIIDSATPYIIEVIFSGPMTVDNKNPAQQGLTHMPNFEENKDRLFNPDGDPLPSELRNNTYVFIAPNLPEQERTLAHEIGHAVTNCFDDAAPAYTFFPDSEPAPTGDTDPDECRRITHVAELNAEKSRDPSCFACKGSMLFDDPTP